MSITYYLAIKCVIVFSSDPATGHVSSALHKTMLALMS